MRRVPRSSSVLQTLIKFCGQCFSVDQLRRVVNRHLNVATFLSLNNDTGCLAKFELGGAIVL